MTYIIHDNPSIPRRDALQIYMFTVLYKYLNQTSTLFLSSCGPFQSLTDKLPEPLQWATLAIHECVYWPISNNKLQAINAAVYLETMFYFIVCNQVYFSTVKYLVYLHSFSLAEKERLSIVYP